MAVAIFSLPSAAKVATKLFPTANSKFWCENVRAEMRNDYIRLGNEYMGKPWTPISDSVFAEFRTNGNRTNYEHQNFALRQQFACMVMAEIMEHKRRFIPDIRRGIHYFINDEKWWGLPAHYPKDHPERDLQVVDLFNSETATMLAWTIYMLGEDIDKQEKGLVDKLESEIERRYLNPTLYGDQDWKHNANNWNTWITSNWVECVMICEKDKAKRDKALKGIKANLMLFLNGYPDDGGCEEGSGYWNHAAGSFFESLYFLDILGKPLELNARQKEKVHAMGRFLTLMHISDLTFVNFSDASARFVPNINILFPYGEYLNDKQMMGFAAYIGNKYKYLSSPTTLFMKSGNIPPLVRELMLLSMLPKFMSTPPTEPHTADAYLANSQIMVASTSAEGNGKHSWFVAAKGGTNGESHNHNDMGNFIVYRDNQPLLIDLGRDTYTSKTFSSHRYELMNNRSAYHNVPLIDGCEQMPGKEYRATNAMHKATSRMSTMTLNIEKAYPDSAGVDFWQREIKLDRIKNCVDITETVRLRHTEGNVGSADPYGPTAIVLMCYGKPEKQNEGCILLKNGEVALRYDNTLLDARIEKVDFADGIMKNVWSDNVYRIMLRLNPAVYNAVARYSLENVDRK